MARVQTYVVRVARPVEDPGGSFGLRGVVHEVSTGHHAVFHDAEELIALLRGRGLPGPEDGVPHPIPSTRE